MWYQSTSTKLHRASFPKKYQFPSRIVQPKKANTSAPRCSPHDFTWHPQHYIMKWSLLRTSLSLVMQPWFLSTLLPGATTVRFVTTCVDRVCEAQCNGIGFARRRSHSRPFRAGPSLLTDCAESVTVGGTSELFVGRLLLLAAEYKYTCISSLVPFLSFPILFFPMRFIGGFLLWGPSHSSH
jgi:hypothetical protein